MIDFLALILGFFLISFLFLIIAIGVKLLYCTATIGKSNTNYNQDIDKQLREDSRGRWLGSVR